VRGLDPVDLVSGKETKGSADISIVRDGFEYHFASNENRQRFEKDARQYEVQFGGACMKMGPLSGKGSAERFAVHQGRIYVFASDQCLATFNAAPDRFTDRVGLPEPPASPSSRRLRRLDRPGAEILQGGLERNRQVSHEILDWFAESRSARTAGLRGAQAFGPRGLLCVLDCRGQRLIGVTGVLLHWALYCGFPVFSAASMESQDSFNASMSSLWIDSLYDGAPY